MKLGLWGCSAGSQGFRYFFYYYFVKKHKALYTKYTYVSKDFCMYNEAFKTFVISGNKMLFIK